MPLPIVPAPNTAIFMLIPPVFDQIGALGISGSVEQIKGFANLLTNFIIELFLPFIKSKLCQNPPASVFFTLPTNSLEIFMLFC
jgi:hypothetical protein